MFNYHSENISEILNVNDKVIQYNYDISKTLTRIKEYFLKTLTNFFYKCLITLNHLLSTFIINVLHLLITNGILNIY